MRAYIINMSLCLVVLLLASCGKQYTAEQTVKDFVAQNLKEGVETQRLDFGDLGTTRHLKDSLVAQLRKNGSSLYKKDITYGQIPAGEVYYLRMTYLHQGDTLQNTFYMDPELKEVIAFK
jgi:hypothetical protein